MSLFRLSVACNYIGRVGGCPVLRTVARSASTETVTRSEVKSGKSDKKHIIIPKRKKRDELSILKALSATVKQDYNAPKYLYMDDPFLAPMSSHDKKSFALAQASGQKAARYVINRYPGNFAHDPSEPKIEAFQPPTGPVFADDTIDGLRERIELRNVLQAYESYNKLTTAGTEVPMDLVEDLLDLLCMYNSDSRPEVLPAEELYYWRDTEAASGPGTSKPRKRFQNMWKSGGAAETLFSQIKEPSAAAYSAMIRGRAKYMESQKAFELFKEARGKGIVFPVETYNAILSVSSFISEAVDSRWDDIKDILSDMASCDVAPNIETFNAALYAVSRCSRYNKSRSWAMMLLNEMKELNIEPTLTTWFHILKTYYFTNDMRSNIMYDILEHLRGKEFILTAPSDYEFFSFAMIKCWENLKDMELGHKLNDLLHVGDNIKLLGDNFKENLYHTHYVRLMATFEPIDALMKHYERIVPNIYTPTYGILGAVMNSIEIHEAYQYIPRIWNDFVLLKYIRRSDLLESLVSVMLKIKPDSEPEVKKVFVSIVDHIIRIFEADAQDPRVINPLTLSGKTLGNIVSIHLWANGFDKAWSTLEMYTENRNKISGFPSEEALAGVAEECIKRKDLEKTLQVLSVMSDLSYPKLDALVERVKETLNPSEEFRRKLDDLV